MKIVSRILASQTFKTLAVFASANMLAAIIQGFCGLLQAHWIAPATLGEFTKFGILTQYSALLLVLVHDGLMRQFPYLIGKGQRDEAVTIAGVAKTWYLIVFGSMTAVFSVLSAVALCQRNFVGAVGWAAQIPAVGAISYGAWMQTIYRRSMEFKRLSYNGLLTSLASAIGLAFSYAWGFWGLAARAMLSNLTRLFFDNKYIPLRIGALWDSRRFANLVKISVPLAVIGYVRTSFLCATFSYLTLRYCGKADLGIYGISVTFQAFALMFNTSLTQIFNVKYAQKFGETESLSKTLRTLLLPTLFGFMSALALAVVLYLLIDPFIRYFIPKYMAAIPVVRVLAIGLPLQALALAPGIMRIALMYKSIYFTGIMKVVSVVVAVMLVPKTIVWMASAMMIGEAVEVIAGWALLLVHTVREGRKA